MPLSDDTIPTVTGRLPAKKATGETPVLHTKPTELEACVTRFKAFHEVARGSVLALKLAKFFAGIEVQTLCDLHAEEYGETRGGDTTASKRDTPVHFTQADYLEQHLGVTKRTAHRYRAHFLSCTEARPEQAAKLRKWWLSWKDAATPQLTQAAPKKGKRGQLTTTGGTPALHSLALQDVCSLTAPDMQSLLDHADEWGLSKLFELPLKDVTPPTDDELEIMHGTSKERLAKFWLKDFARRAGNNEFLKLRKQDKEALLVTWEEALDKLRDSLKGKK